MTTQKGVSKRVNGERATTTTVRFPVMWFGVGESGLGRKNRHLLMGTSGSGDETTRPLDRDLQGRLLCSEYVGRITNPHIALFPVSPPSFLSCHRDPLPLNCRPG